MVRFDGLGADGDQVQIALGGDTVKVAEHYEVRAGVLTQPSAFSLRLGHGGVARELTQKYPPRTPFTLFVGDRKVQTGWTDGFEGDDSGRNATQVTLQGRDALAPLHDAFLTQERSFKESSFLDLTTKALEAVGLSDRPLLGDNLANRKAITGADVEEILSPLPPDDKTPPAPNKKKVVYRTIKAQLGERWYEFLRRQYDRAGLFLWASAEGNFILSRPNPHQLPTYRILRVRGQSRNAVSVTRAHFRNNVARRYTQCIVYGRAGGRKFGRTKVKGVFVDPEMAALFGGEDKKPLVVHDTTVKNRDQAELLARRKIAQANREGWQLTYTVSGHSIPSIAPGGGRAVWAPDTVCEVQDDEYGIQGLFYLESIIYRRGPQTTTALTLMRPQDLVFATEAQFQ